MRQQLLKFVESQILLCQGDDNADVYYSISEQLGITRETAKKMVYELAMSGGTPNIEIVNDVPRFRTKPIILQLTRTSSDEPARTHGGLTQFVYWTLDLNGVQIECDENRFHWDVNAAQRDKNGAVAPRHMQMKYEQLARALGIDNAKAI